MTTAPRIEVQAPPEVHDALAAMGRTEDVRLAPSGQRIAFACFTRDRVALLDIEIVGSMPHPEVRLDAYRELCSPALAGPHGVDFVDDDTLIVASRAGGVSLFRVSDIDGGPEQPAVVIDSGPPGGLASPGSVAVRRAGDAGLEALVCDNHANTITRHALDGSEPVGAVAARRWLDLPDGIAASRDGRWVAVSNHNTHSVFLYETASLGEAAEPVCVLRGARYPHGLRFGADDATLVVADAGAPYVYLFAAPSGTWHGAGYPAASVRVMDDETFARGNHSPQEGGPKGIDMDPRTNVLIVTAETTPVAFFDLSAVVRPTGFGADPCGLVRYELHALQTREGLKKAAAEATAKLKAIQRTKAWRAMEPARRAYRTAIRLRRRR